MVGSTCDCAPLQGKRDFADGLELGIFRWGLSWMTPAGPVSSQSSSKRESGGAESEKIRGQGRRDGGTEGRRGWRDGLCGDGGRG